MTKFKFNFSFLDRFKKQKNEEEQDQETPPPSPEDRTGSHRVQFDELTNEESDSHSEFDSDETPEEFAEKSLSAFNIEELRQQLKDSENSKANHIEAEYTEEENDEENHQEFAFQEMPSKPEVASKFKIKFPKFNREETAAKIKNAFAARKGMGEIRPLDKLSWNDFILRLFSPYTRGKIHSAFLILFVASLTYMIGKNIALFLNRTPPVAKVVRPVQIPLERADSTLSDLNKITSTNLFNAKESDKGIDQKNQKDIDSIVCLDADHPTNAQIKLLDTIVLQDSVKSVASVQVRGSSELMNVREGERVEDMVEVSKIDRMKIILKNLQTGDCEYASSETEMESPIPPMRIVSPKAGKAMFKSLNPNIKNVGNSFKIKRAYRDQLMNNMSDVLTQARAIQITNPDGSLCFKMTEVVPGSIYSQLNIQENDIICNINGKKIDNLNELMGLLGRIKEIDQFQIGLKRNGMSENLEYGFE